MHFFKKFITLIFLLNGSVAFADLQKASSIYFTYEQLLPKHYQYLVKELLNNNLYFAAIPWAKEYLNGRRVSSRDFDRELEKLVGQVGGRQFSVLPISVLEKSSNETFRYLLAKKHFMNGEYNKAWEIAGLIPAKSFQYPFALNIQASALSILGKASLAVKKYDQCMDQSKSKSGNSTIEKNQLLVNHDLCVIGKARVEFSRKNYKKASSIYLDISKDSYIWPIILFEEAWNSYYLGEYNRTLGKLVTYKSPFLDFIFNPEASVLESLSYLKLCLWDDAKSVSDNFYNNYSKPLKGLKNLLDNYGTDYLKYFKLARSKKTSSEFVNRILKGLKRELIYKEMMFYHNQAITELNYIKRRDFGKLKKVIYTNTLESISMQRKLIGAYTRNMLLVEYIRFRDAFEKMSYIKLEILNKKRTALLNPDENRTRGDVKYIKRSEKQYFWTFNGEFWADELGDHIFALKSECR